MKFATVVLFILVYTIVLPPIWNNPDLFSWSDEPERGKVNSQNHRIRAPSSVRGNLTVERVSITCADRAGGVVVFMSVYLSATERRAS